jgi:hypothetical protein
VSTRHAWDHANERRLSSGPDGNARNERDCIHCGMTRITVIPPHGFPWHEWRTREGKVWVGEATPPCVERGGASLKGAS